MKKIFFIATLLFCVNILFAENNKTENNKTNKVEAEIVSEVKTIEAGKPFWTALHLIMQPHWHVYWSNPGDAGTPVSISWKLPEGFSVGEIQWPFPERVRLDEFANYGYNNEVFLLVEITPPALLKNDETITLKATADWLVCKENCIPESAELMLQLKVAEGMPKSDERWIANFSDTRSKLPLLKSDWEFKSSITDSILSITAKPPKWFDGNISQIDFFPHQEYVVNNGAKQITEKVEDTYVTKIKLSEEREEDPAEISGILISDNGWRGEGSEKSVEINIKVEKNVAINPTSQSDISSFWVALIFAFLGGIILNLMPCVLPVLSLKILGFVHQAGEDKKKTLHHGLAFMFGVVVSFWVLSGALLIIRAGGEQLGWGFQLQSPIFLIILSVFFFLFALSLFGVFEIGTTLTGVGQGSKHSGLLGSFISGITATIIATPCTAPFMGSAMGFALSRPVYESMSIFTFLGLGMASPYVLLAANPKLLKFIPKPGVWMDTLKQFMGFLLVATVIWLIWVFSFQVESDKVILLLFTLLFVSIGGWIIGRWGTIVQVKRTRTIAWIIASLIILGSTANNIKSVVAKEHHSVVWQKYSPELVAKLQSEGKPIFVDYTAKWCLSCQVNKKIALHNEEVEKEFIKRGIVTIEADWTNKDETIAKGLAEFGRNSVPLYVLYSSDVKQKPVVLPEVLTPGIVLDALSKIKLEK